jgi:hypothetical protein
MEVPASGEVARVTISAGVAGIDSVARGTVAASRNRVVRADSPAPPW